MLPGPCGRDAQVSDDCRNTLAFSLPLLFVGLAIASFVLHCLLRDTDDQFRSPHRPGPMTLPAIALQGFMGLPMPVEIGGFCVLLYGFLAALA